jgi:hypothetical protein
VPHPFPRSLRKKVGDSTAFELQDQECSCLSADFHPSFHLQLNLHRSFTLLTKSKNFLELELPPELS